MNDTTEPDASVVDQLREAFDALPDRDRKWTTEIGCNYVGRFRILGISHIQKFINFTALAHNAMPEILNELEALSSVATAAEILIDTIEQKSKDACRIYSGEGSVLFEHKDILAAIRAYRKKVAGE